MTGFVWQRKLDSMHVVRLSFCSAAVPAFLRLFVGLLLVGACSARPTTPGGDSDASSSIDATTADRVATPDQFASNDSAITPRADSPVARDAVADTFRADTSVAPSVDSAATCAEVDQSCSSASECCSGECLLAQCDPSGCNASGYRCQQPSDCCSGRCASDGFCIPAVCKRENEACSQGIECCNRMCDFNTNRCVGACLAQSEICVRDEECCDGACVIGRCDNDPRVIPSGVRCGSELMCSRNQLCCVELERGLRDCRVRDCPIFTHVPYECDGPEDCRTGLVCCLDHGSAFQPTRCAPSCLAGVGAQRCHTAAHCGGDAPFCCDWPGATGEPLRKCSARRPDDGALCYD